MMFNNVIKNAIRSYSTVTPKIYDITIVGSGIVGTATGREILRKYPGYKVLLVDKEDGPGRHQSSHNSGVIHAGIYYKPGSTKARLCVKGADLMYDYLESKSIPHERCGKLIVATDSDQLKRLDDLHRRGQENQVKGLKILEGRDEIQRYEPHIDGGIKAIYSPNTGIVDYGQVVNSFCDDIRESGGEILFNFQVDSVKYLESDKLLLVGSGQREPVLTRYLISCAGMNSDRVSRLAFGSKDPGIVPFRGSFLKFKPEFKHLIRGNVYPVNNPAFPFLGIHFTKRINGDIWLGPNAVLALHREGYTYRDLSLHDTVESLSNHGLQRLISRHWQFGIKEMAKDIFKSQFVKDLKPFMSYATVDMIEYAGSGVRSQAIDDDGSLIEDFIFDSPPDKPILHVRNSPSPSATSSIAIAQEILSKFESKFLS